MKDIDKTAYDWLHTFGIAALILSLLVFGVYVSGLVPSVQGPAESAAHWDLPTAEYQELLDTGSGSLWMFRGFDGYGISTAALAILASTALPTLLALSIAWFRRKERLYGSMALMVAAVLVTAILS